MSRLPYLAGPLPPVSDALPSLARQIPDRVEAVVEQLPREVRLIEAVIEQLPRDLREKLAVRVVFKGAADPDRMRDAMAFFTARGSLERGPRQWACQLEPVEIDGVAVPMHVPDDFLAMLCLVV